MGKFKLGRRDLSWMARTASCCSAASRKASRGRRCLPRHGRKVALDPFGPHFSQTLAGITLDCQVVASDGSNRGLRNFSPPAPRGPRDGSSRNASGLVSGNGFKLRQSRASQVVPPPWTRGSAQTLHWTGSEPVFFCPDLRIRSWRRRECGRVSRPRPLPAAGWRICARDGRREPMRAASAPPGCRSTCRPFPCRGRCGDR
jgi:hypothetical protein